MGVDPQEVTDILALRADFDDDVRYAPETPPKEPSRTTVLSFFCSIDTMAQRGDAAARKPSAPPCVDCGSDRVVTKIFESRRVCTECGSVERIVIENERPIKRDVARDTSTFTFKRLSHFNEWLDQIQGKDHPSIPESVIASIVDELKKINITNGVDVKRAHVRTILKTLGLNRWYEHTPYIHARLRGVQPDRMPLPLQNKLRVMFETIQAPFLNHSPPTRKNFLSYGYVLYKFVQLLGEDRYLQMFPLLKSQEKLLIQDNIWKSICSDLDWEFIPSL
jgi:hypothetical protein